MGIWPEPAKEIFICSRCNKEHQYYMSWGPFVESETRYICRVCWTEVMDKLFNLNSKFNLENEKILYEE